MEQAGSGNILAGICNIQSLTLIVETWSGVLRSFENASRPSHPRCMVQVQKQYHSAPTGARNSSLGHPNMAEASLGKNVPKMISSLLRVFSGWYLQGLVIWCVSLSRPQNFWWKRRHIARRGGDISSRNARISTFVQLLDALNSFQGCPRLMKDARISPTCSPIDARVSKENSPSDII